MSLSLSRSPVYEFAPTLAPLTAVICEGTSSCDHRRRHHLPRRFITTATTTHRPGVTNEIISTTTNNSHIVFMMVDDMGHNDMGYSSSDMTFATQTLNHMAANGIRLQRYYTASSCTPARVSFLTGRYPSNVGMGYDDRGAFVAVSPYGVPLSVEMLPQHLKKIGYRTAVVGKWNVGHFEESYLPHRRGFDSALTFQSDEMHYYNYTLEPRLQGIAPIDMLEGKVGYPYVKSESFANTYSSELFATRAVEEIMITGANVSGVVDVSPLFLYVAFQAVHVPHDTPPADLYDDDVDAWMLDNVISQDDERQSRAHFGKTMVAMDRSIKRIMDALDLNGMMDSTFIAVASDNGGCPSDGSNNYPLRGGKFDLFEGGVQVPAFIYAPGLLPSSVQGTSFYDTFHVTDWLPTLLRLADSGYTLDDSLDGVDQLGLLFEGTSRTGARDETLLGLNRWYVSMSFDVTNLEFENSKGGLIYNNYKYIQGQVDRSWYAPLGSNTGNCTCGVVTSPVSNFLFDLSEDPTEQHNLVDELPEVAAMMAMRLRAHYDNATVSQWMAPEVSQCVKLWADEGYMVPWHKPEALENTTRPGGNDKPGADTDPADGPTDTGGPTDSPESSEPDDAPTDGSAPSTLPDSAPDSAPAERR